MGIGLRLRGQSRKKVQHVGCGNEKEIVERRPRSNQTKKRASCAGRWATLCMHQPRRQDHRRAHRDAGWPQKSAAVSWLGCAARWNQSVSYTRYHELVGVAGVEGEAKGASKSHLLLLFVLTRRKVGGEQTSSVVSEMTLSMDTQKKAVAVEEARALAPHGHERKRARAANARVNAAAPPCASIAQGEEQRGMEQDFDAQSEHANLKGRRGSACKIPAAPRRNTFDTRATHRWRIALWRESSFGDLWYPCARTIRMICGW